MAVFSHKVERKELKLGDHIYSWRKLHSYAHHGIYCGRDGGDGGDDMIIHFRAPKGKREPLPTLFSPQISPPPRNCNKCRDYRKTMMGDPNKAVDEVSISCLDCFLAGGKLKRAEYSVSEFEVTVKRSMTCFTATADPPEKVLERATSTLQTGFGKYHLVENNCEKFAFFCKTGNDPPRERENKFWIATKLVAKATKKIADASKGPKLEK